ncbi:PREDICTED: malignant fibrous histiocytoma-amplified sequence 1 homolog [Branchiostoma belcheri]|uniref:non-specific serine/threonine protein kinase n=1 Tax=Branchiostoma belcheri TaxID=7741 RepID=A0A6P4ZR76_BRABE|nr:PREDICTED: malignant fibrous histiocytoma-amplified sequence 1 homolog [Branchiostoma belcheri]
MAQPNDPLFDLLGFEVNPDETELLNINARRLKELPKELCKFKGLKTLIADMNELTAFPPVIFNFKLLGMLNLRANKITLVPQNIGELCHLQSLFIDGNELVELPDSLCDLPNLIDLHASGNKLTSLPRQIGKLRSLSVLSVSRNAIERLPPSIVELSRLKGLFLQYNNITSLPPSFGEALMSAQVRLHGNPLTQPPTEVCEQGILAIRAYQDELQRSEAVVTPRLKIVLIGESLAGKTSLINALVEGKSNLTGMQDRTHCVNIVRWSPSEDVVFEVYDFGGHEVYYMSHQYFITDGGLNIVTFDLHAYVSDDFDKAVGTWVKTVNTRAPGSTVWVVGTHSDLCEDEEIKKKCGDVESKLQTLCVQLKDEVEVQIKRLQDGGEGDQRDPRIRETLEHLLYLQQHPLRVATSVSAVSSAEELRGIVDLKDRLSLLVEKEADLYPSLRRALPKTWSLMEGELEAQREGRKIFLTWEDCVHLGQNSGLESDRLQPVLQYLHRTGRILYYGNSPNLSGYVFHDPTRLVDILKEIFNHDMEGKVLNEDSLTGRLYNMTLYEMEQSRVDLRERGLMTRRLLQALLRGCVGDGEVEVALDLMRHFGLCYAVRDPDETTTPHKVLDNCAADNESGHREDSSDNSDTYRFPWYINSQEPPCVQVIWNEGIPSTETLQILLQISGFYPPSLFERFCVDIHPHMQYRQDWKGGVVGFCKDMPVLIKIRKRSRSVDVSISTRGCPDEDIMKMRGAVFPMAELLHDIMKEWPGLLYSVHTTCPHCLQQGVERPHLFPGEWQYRQSPPGVSSLRCPLTFGLQTVKTMLLYMPGVAGSTMSAYHKKKIQDHWDTLVSQMNTKFLLPTLVQENVINDDIAEQLLHVGRSTSSSRDCEIIMADCNKKLLETLQSRGDRAFTVLCMALRQGSEQRFLADLLEA